jgi:hypothetical protein
MLSMVIIDFMFTRRYVDFKMRGRERESKRKLRAEVIERIKVVLVH